MGRTSAGPGDKGDHLGELFEIGRRGTARIQTDGEDGELETFVVDVDEMQLCLAAIAADGVVGWSVDVPALEIGGLVVPFQFGERCVVVFWMVEGVSRAVTPIRPVTHDIAVVIFEGWMVMQREAIGEGKSDGGLLSPGLASGIFGSDGTPVVGSVVGPVSGDIGRVGGADFCTFVSEVAWGQMASLESGVIRAAEDGPHCEEGGEE